LALGCALVATIGVMELTVNRKTNAEDTGETQPIFVAMTDIGMGDLLTSEVLKLEQWPKDKVPPGSISDIKEIEGRRSRTRLYPNEPILEDKLLAKGTSEQGASALIPKDYRIATVRVDPVSGGGNLILPGDRVDVMVYLVRDPNKGINDTMTRTFLQDVKVFAVDNVVNLEKDKDGNKSIAAKTISLLVTPEQAALIDMATHSGSINLVMRSIDDDKQGPNAEARTNQLFGSTNKTNREKELQKTPPVEPTLDDKANEYLSAVNASKKAKTPDAAKAPPSGDTWTMRVLKPGGVEEVKFEANADNSASPFGTWKITVNNVNSEGGPSGGKGSSVADSPADKGSPLTELPALPPDLPPMNPF
jgi:pilus assembly protein CpaB